MADRWRDMPGDTLDKLSLLQSERNWHVETVLKTNAQFAIGAAAVLAAAAFGGDDLRAALAGTHQVVRVVSASLVALGGLVFAAAMIIHWNFRLNRAQECAAAMARLVDCGDATSDISPTSLFVPAPPQRPFSWLLGAGWTLLILGCGTALVAIAMSA